MKRWLVGVIACLAIVLLATCVFMIAWLFIPFFRTWIGFDFKDGKDIIPSLPALVQLGSFALLAVAGLLCLLLRKRYSFVFHGFKNASIVPDVEKRPIDIDVLAQEELVRQLKYLYHSLEQYTNGESDDAGEFDVDALIKEPPFVNQYAQQEEEPLLDLAQFLPHGEAENIIVELKQLIKTFQSGKESEDLLKMIGESAPDDIAPFMKLIDAVTPREVIEVTGHLQWQGETLEPRKVGITLECAGSDEMMTRTIWWRHPNNHAISTTNKGSTGDTKKGRFRNGNHALKRSNIASMVEVTGHYIELLRPAMCWLALTLWESNYRLRHPNLTMHRLAKLHYLLGTLYYAYSQSKFSQYGDFFWERAVEHLDQALSLDPNWCYPELYVAVIYSNQLQRMREDDPHREKVLHRVLQRYNDFLKHTEMAEKRLRSQLLLWPWRLITIQVPLLPSLLHDKKKKEVLLIRRKLTVGRAATVLKFLDEIKSSQVNSVLSEHKVDSMSDADVIDMVQMLLQETMQKVGLIAEKTDKIDGMIEALQNNGLIETEVDGGKVRVKIDASLIRAMTPERRIEAMEEALDNVMIKSFTKMLDRINSETLQKDRKVDSSYLYNLAYLDCLSIKKSISEPNTMQPLAQQILKESLLRSPELWSVVEKNDCIQENVFLKDLKKELSNLSK